MIPINRCQELEMEKLVKGPLTSMEITLKTVFQSQEMLVGEKETMEVKAPFGFPNKHRRTKAVSPYGAARTKASNNLSWSLQLKKSSASTNVSILNLTESESFDCETAGNNQSSSSDSDGSEKPAEFQTDSAALYENLEQSQQEVEDLDICNRLEEKLSCLTKKLWNICDKRERLNNLKYEVLKEMSSFQGLLQSVEFRSETSLLRDLSQNMVSLCGEVKKLQHSLETTRYKEEQSKATEKQEMTILMNAIEEIRNSVTQICENFEAASSLLKNIQRTVFHINARIEFFISQGSCAQDQQDLLVGNIQELSASLQSLEPL
ncbi:testis-specific serine kinase substrate [Leptodactylus fuscus]